MRKTLTTLPVLCALVAFAASAQQPTLQSLADELDLQRIPALVEAAVDRKDWAAARAHFADQVRIDFTSLTGGEPATISSNALIAGWSGNLKGDKQSLHIRGHALVEVSGDRATVRSSGYAWNRKPGGPNGDLWEVWGHYIHDFARTPQGWRIVGFAFQKTHERGSAWVRDTPGS
jgi:ketosteroid isomerase-like protein